MDTVHEVFSRSAAELDAYRAQVVFVVTIIFAITSTGSVYLRLAAKRISRAELGAEDYVILVAAVSISFLGFLQQAVLADFTQAVNLVHVVLVMLC